MFASSELPRNTQMKSCLLTMTLLISFAVNFSVPYLVLKTQVGLGSKVGFIFGAISLLSLVFTYFCVPECKGKTLEQVDWLFNNNVKLRRFGDADASGMLDGSILEDVKGSPNKDNTCSHMEKV
jgi:hypothetical protein